MEFQDDGKVPWIDESIPVPPGWKVQEHTRSRLSGGNSSNNSVYYIYFGPDGSRYRSLKSALERIRDDGHVLKNTTESALDAQSPPPVESDQGGFI